MSDNYVVSAIKYRPQLFNTVIGQGHITTTLKNAIKTEQLAHSFLFCGPRGVGKTTCARILAKTINCTNRTEDAEACDTCPSCVSYKDNNSFNVYEMDAASNSSVDDIRELIEQVRFAPQGGSKYKVYIIDEVHMLSTNAFNAFLKTLEEPPHYAIFILATTEKHKIIPTILSRCQIFDFNRITSHDTIEHLAEICDKEHISFEKEALHLIAQKSEGCMRDALSIMDKIASFSRNKITYESTVEHLNILDYDYYFKLMESFMMQDMSSVMLLYDDIFSKGFEGDMFLNGFTEHLRNLLICKDSRVAKLLDLPENIKIKYFQQANQVSSSYIINALSILNASEINYKVARNKRMHVELALIKLNYLSSAIEIISEDGGDIYKKKILNANLSVIVQRKKQEKEPALSIEIEKVVEPQRIISEPPISISTPTSASNEKSMQYGVTLGSIKGLKGNAKEKLEASHKSKQVLEISTENLEVAWNQIIEELTTEKVFFRNAIKQGSIEFEGQCITIHVFGVAYDFLKTLRLKLLDFFKQHYHDDSINVIINEKAPAAEKMVEQVLSTKEIFEKMVIQNPLLAKLKDKLGMEFDH